MPENLFEKVVKRKGWLSELRAGWAISIRIWKVEFSYPLSMLWFIVMPFLWFIPMLLAGTSVSGGIESQYLGDLTGITDWVSYVAIGSAFTGLIMATLVGTGLSLRREQNVGTLETILTTPINKSTLVWGSAMHNILHGGLGVILQLVASVILFGVTINVWGIVPALGIVALGLIGLQGIVFAIVCIVLVAKQAWQIVEVVLSGLTLLAPVAYPIAVLPPILQYLSVGSPLTWTVDGFRGFLIYGLAVPGITNVIVTLLILDTVYIVLGLLLYRYTEQWIRRRGALAQF